MGNFTFYVTRPLYQLPRNIPNFTEIGQRLLAKIVFTDIRQTDRHITDTKNPKSKAKSD